MEETVVDDGREVVVDERLRRAGRAHVEAVDARAPGLFDGPVLAFRALADGRIQAGRSDYLTMLATSASLAPGPGARERRAMAAAAAGDAVTSGAGRAAVVGLSVVVVVVVGGGAPHLLLGRRRPDLAVEPGRWGLVAGAVEPGAGERPLRAGLARELAEEVPGLLALARARPAAVAARGRVLGLGFNLERLSPTVLVAVTVRVDRTPGPRELLSGDEFTGSRLVPATPAGRAGLWAALGPDMTANAAAALAAWEDR